MNFKLADRLSNLPPYPFAELDRLKKEALAKGVDLIDMGIGDPDQPTPKHIINKLKEASENPKNHKYASYVGMPEFRRAVQNYYKKRFDVSLNPDNEIVTLIGSKEGIAHIPLAFVNPGEYVLVPDPGYPVYNVSTIFAGGIPYQMPLLEKNNFLPDFKSIPLEIAKKSKMLFLNYPNNPTAAVAPKSFFEGVVEFAKSYGIIVCHDAAYLDMNYEEYSPVSFLQVNGAKEVGIEFHSLSKTYNMTGWRIGFASGNKDLVSGLTKIKTNVDSGVFQAVQEAGIQALSGEQKEVEKTRKLYTQRRDVLIKGLKSIGLNVNHPKATFYVWMHIPKSFKTSTEFATFLLTKGGIVSTPGTAFGKYGEGFIRFALTQDKKRIETLISRMKEILK